MFYEIPFLRENTVGQPSLRIPDGLCNVGIIRFPY